MNPSVASVIAAADTAVPGHRDRKRPPFLPPEKPGGRGTEVYTDKDLCRDEAVDAVPLKHR